MTKRLVERAGGTRALSSSVEYALNLKLAVLLAGVPADLVRAENAFIRLLRPVLNTPKNVKPISASTVMGAFAGGPA